MVDWENHLAYRRFTSFFIIGEGGYFEARAELALLRITFVVLSGLSSIFFFVFNPFLWLFVPIRFLPQSRYQRLFLGLYVITLKFWIFSVDAAMYIQKVYFFIHFDHENIRKEGSKIAYLWPKTAQDGKFILEMCFRTHLSADTGFVLCELFESREFWIFVTKLHFSFWVILILENEILRIERFISCIFDQWYFFFRKTGLCVLSYFFKYRNGWLAL